jgi:cytochrome c6
MQSGLRLRRRRLLSKAVVLLSAFLLFYLPHSSTAARSKASSPHFTKEIFTEHCSQCHGADGRARTAKGKRTGATDLTGDWNTSEERGLRIISKGKGEMPAFRSKLTPGQIRSVWNYVLTFRKEQ